MRHGFTLVELAIVLVIIGLLVGGVMGGQVLMRASQLRAVGAEFDRYQTASRAFRDKYFAIPGDMLAATRIWGKDATYCNGDTGAASTTGTCNGDGDDTVSYSTAGATGEAFQYWRQLALSGLIEGTYSGVAGAGGTGMESDAGSNVPRSKMNNGGWSVNYHNGYAGDAISFAMSYQNYFIFGASSGTDMMINPVLTPNEAWDIDSKYDDGKPGYGKITANYWDNSSNTGCTKADDGSDANTDLDASYRKTDEMPRCSLNFLRIF